MPVPETYEPRVPTQPPSGHVERRTAALQALGWSKSDAEWLVLVCLHSGVFTRRQYQDWYHRDKHAASRFVQRLTAAGVAREHPLPGRLTPARFCHVFGRGPYRALGIENAGQRRLGSPALLWRRLLALDCLLAYPDADWLATGPEKAQHFLKRGVPEDILPQRFRGDLAFRHAALNPITDGNDQVSFVFPDPGHGTNRALRYWASDHQLLWCFLRANGVKVEVVVSIRDDGVKNLYEKTLLGWTPAAHALNEDELSFLHAIQASRRHPDPDDLEKWLGMEEANAIEARLTARQDGAVARIDRFTIHVAHRLNDFRLDGAFLE